MTALSASWAEHPHAAPAGVLLVSLCFCAGGVMVGVIKVESSPGKKKKKEHGSLGSLGS